jgi:hypothetical protein
MILKRAGRIRDVISGRIHGGRESFHAVLDEVALAAT